MMLLSLDGRTVYSAARRGTGKNLVDLYRRMAEMRPGWRLVAFHRGAGSDDPFAHVANIENRAIEIKGDRFGLWTHIRLPLAAKTARADLLHCPANTGPRWPLVPMVLTIHDLIPLEPDSGHPNPDAWVRNVGRAARKARRVMTPSEYSKRLIVEMFGVSADKIVVNHWAADTNCCKVTDRSELARVREKYGLHPDRPYVFGFGGEDARKNTRRIIDAWSALADRTLKDCQMLLVGCQEGVLAELRAHARKSGVTDSVLLHGFAAEEDIPALLTGAEAICYASLSEGFGLPVLDAFACEAAVLTSNVTSLPEVAGDAALLVNPRETSEITKGLAMLLEDEGLRSNLVARGAERVRQFTWEACAQRACRVFEDAIGGTA